MAFPLHEKDLNAMSPASSLGFMVKPGFQVDYYWTGSVCKFILSRMVCAHCGLNTSSDAQLGIESEHDLQFLASVLQADAPGAKTIKTTTFKSSNGGVVGRTSTRQDHDLHSSLRRLHDFFANA